MSKFYTLEQLKDAIKSSFSLAETLRKLGVNKKGNDKAVKIEIKNSNIDISHWLGRSANAGKSNSGTKGRRHISELLVENAKLTDSSLLKRRLLEINLLIYECSICKISSWFENKLVLQLDHINGVNNDNRLENLRLLCPNCHSQTDTYCGKNRNVYDLKDKEITKKNKYLRSKVPCPTKNCLNTKKKEAAVCQECSIKLVLSETKKKQVINWPDDEVLLKMVNETSYPKVAKKLNTSTTRVFNKVKKYKKSLNKLI